MQLIFESSERSDSSNIARQKLEELNFKMITYEGYTVKNNTVSLLLDRAKLITDVKVSLSNLYQAIRKEIHDIFQIKVDFAKKLNVPWYFVVYTEDEYSVVLDMLNNGTEVIRFNSFKELGEWTMEYRDYVMRKPYQEGGLPNIDIKMRENGIPWPGNMDKALCINNKVAAIIEFQNTSRVTVREHENNNFFRMDEGRWRVLDILKQHSQLPLLVIVWSRKENTIGLKLVDHIIYTDIDQYHAGINWGTIMYSSLNNLHTDLSTILKINQ